MSTVEELRDNYRTRFTDNVAQQYALNDDGFLDYLNEAQDEACIRADLIFDKTSAFCTIPVTSGVSVYAIEPRIVGIVYARIVDAASQYSLLTATTREDLDLDNPAWRTDTGPPDSFLHAGNTIELAPTPVAAYTLKLDVFRLAAKLTGDNSVPEFNEMHHRPLLYWVLYRMYSMPDEDVSNPRKALENLAEFTKIFGERRLAGNFRDKFMSRPHVNRSAWL